MCVVWGPPPASLHWWDFSESLWASAICRSPLSKTRPPENLACSRKTQHIQVAPLAQKNSSELVRVSLQAACSWLLCFLGGRVALLLSRARLGPSLTVPGFPKTCGPRSSPPQLCVTLLSLCCELGNRRLIKTHSWYFQGLHLNLGLWFYNTRTELFSLLQFEWWLGSLINSII